MLILLNFSKFSFEQNAPQRLKRIALKLINKRAFRSFETALTIDCSKRGKSGIRIFVLQFPSPNIVESKIYKMWFSLKKSMVSL